ncbi:MAG: hypothetical protein D8M58_06685 [Calditrichaeota bacterium]|nr:MAG: hypothetical protein DWQ03_19815 [Calditrichota bacterium]MBL1205064.1 hypothetical protein [Calditrichota bacterium]NOG44894.1 hypothetical protein [Calditrichota bacterium]
MKSIQPVFLISFIISLVLHVLILFTIYFPSTIVTIILTVGMFASWLYVSNTFKDLSGENKDFHIMQYLQKLTPTFKFSLLFFALYAFLNFAYTLSFDSNAGWVDFDLGYDKLRGISGFWMFLYFLAFNMAYLQGKKN